MSWEPPDSLAAVNRVLDGREARIVFTDSTEAVGREVSVAADSVRFWTEEARRAIPTGDVRRITYERDRFSPGKGVLGGLMLGAGVITACYLTGEGDPLCLAFGGLVMMGGAVIGGGLGILEQAGSQERIAYEAPLSRYAGTRE